MKSKSLTDSESIDEDAIRAVITEAISVFGSEERLYELTGHKSGRKAKHTWVKNGIPVDVAYILDDLTDGYFDAAQLNRQIKTCREVRALHLQIDKAKGLESRLIA